MRQVAIIPDYREVGKIGRVIERFAPDSVDEIYLIVDNPNAAILAEIETSRKQTTAPIRIIENTVRKGIGYAIKQGYTSALSEGADIIVVMAGNGKDDPREIPRLTSPIIRDCFDYVQGSRFLPGGRGERTPFLRGIFTRLFPFAWTLLTGVHCTEVTNGFRAYRAAVLQDPEINVWQALRSSNHAGEAGSVRYLERYLQRPGRREYMLSQHKFPSVSPSSSLPGKLEKSIEPERLR